MVKEQQSFTDQDLTLEGYQGFSGAAILCFLFAVVAAVIAVANKAWLFLTIFAAAFAVLTLVRLHRAKPRTTGFKLTRLSLAICLTTFGAVLAYHQIRLNHLFGVARQHAETWLKLSQEGRVHETYQLMFDYSKKRKKPGSDLVLYYGTVERPSAPFSTYLTAEPELSLRKDGDRAEIIWMGARYRKEQHLSEVFVNQFSYMRPNETEARIFNVHMKRIKYPPPHGVQWSVQNVTNIRPRITRVLTSEQMGGG